MSSFQNKMYPFLFAFLIFFLSANYLHAGSTFDCNDLSIHSDTKSEATKIIKALEQFSYIKKLENDSLIGTLICLSQKTDDAAVRSHTFNIQGQRYFENSDFMEAKKMFQKVLDISQKDTPPNQVAEAHNYLARVCEMEGRILAAYKHDLAQFELSKKYNLKSLSRTYLSLGQFHYYTKNYEQAENLYLQGIAVLDSSDVTRVEYGWNLHRLGELYRVQNRHKDALFFIQRALDFWEKTDNYRAYCFSLNQNALLHNNQGKNEKALQLANKAYTISEKDNLWLSRIGSLLILGKIHYSLKNIVQSIDYLEQAIALGTLKSNSTYSKECHELLVKAYVETGQTIKAKESYRIYLEEVKKSLKRDNIANKEWAKKNQDLLLSKQSVQELEEKEKFANQKMALQKKLMLFGLLIIIFISWLARNYFKANKKVLKHQSQLLKLNETIKEQSQQLQEANTKISHKNNALELELVKKLLMLSKQAEAIQNMEKQLASMAETQANNALRKEVNNAKNDTSWEELDLQINQANSELFQALSQKFDNLSQNDLRLCAFLKMNMRTKEIANLTFKNPASVKVARSRLRKKLGLTHSSMTISTFLNRL